MGFPRRQAPADHGRAVNNRSIAYGIARACRREGAELAFSYQGERFKRAHRRVRRRVRLELIFDCDVADDAQIDALFAPLGEAWPSFDGFVHCDRLRAARGDRRRLPRRPVARERSASPTTSRPTAFRPWPRRRRRACARRVALLTLTYLGAVRSVPNYNTMGLAKASLEASVRYLAQQPGPKGVRVNGISAGPIKTLAAAGIKDFGKILQASSPPPRRSAAT